MISDYFITHVIFVYSLSLACFFAEKNAVCQTAADPEVIGHDVGLDLSFWLSDEGGTALRR